MWTAWLHNSATLTHSCRSNIWKGCANSSRQWNDREDQRQDPDPKPVPYLIWHLTLQLATDVVKQDTCLENVVVKSGCVISHNCGKRGHIAAACRGKLVTGTKELEDHMYKKAKQIWLHFLLVIQVVQKIYTCLQWCPRSHISGCTHRGQEVVYVGGHRCGCVSYFMWHATDFHK